MIVNKQNRGYAVARFLSSGVIFPNYNNTLYSANGAGEFVTSMNIVSAEWSIGNNASWTITRGANTHIILSKGQHTFDLSDGRLLDMQSGEATSPIIVTKNGSGPGTLILKIHKQSRSLTAEQSFLDSFVDATDALIGIDFTTFDAYWMGEYVGAPTNISGWSFTRSSGGFAQTVAGLLQWFASGELRRTDKGVLIEGARTNLLLRSQEFDNASWTKTNCTVVANAATAPDGTLTADKIVENSATAKHQINNNIAISVTSGQSYVISFYAKAGERTRVRGEAATGVFGTNDTLWDLNAGTVVSGSTGGIQALGNDWYRCWWTVTASSTTTALFYLFTDNGSSGNYTGDGSSGLYLWGAQLEAASFPSSYIPTTTASATRTSDVLTVPVSGLTTHSVLAEMEVAVIATDQRALAITDGTTANRTLLWLSNGVPGFQVRAGAAISAAITIGSVVTAGSVIKLAGRAAENDMQEARGGVLGILDSSAALPTGLTTIDFNNGGVPTFGYIRRVAIWNRALTDAELQVVTL